MLVSDIVDSVTAETGGVFSPEFASKVIVDVSRDFCRYSFAMNKYSAEVFQAADVDPDANYSVISALYPYTDTEPCGLFGLTVNGLKMAGVERDAVSPSGAVSAVGNSGGLFYSFSTQTTCQIHPLPYGGDVRFFAAFMPVITASQIEDALWNLYGDGIMNGIKAKLLMMPGYQTSNPNAAVVFGNEYLRAKKMARADTNRLVIGEVICS